MRHVLFLTLFLLAIPVAAQEEPIPDTTEAWLYYPLAVGNVWEYYRHHPVGDMAYERVVIPKDTLIEGTRYFIREYYEAPYEGGGTAWEWGGRSIVRFDTLLARPVVYRDGGEISSGCPYDADFGSVIPCEGIEGEYEVDGGYLLYFLIGEDSAPAFAQKGFEPVHIPYDGPVCSHVAPIGFAGCDGFWHIGIESYDLRFTRLVREGEIVEYGTPVPVSNEPGTQHESTHALRAYPNPFTEAVTLRLDVPSPQRVTVAVFDALGRRVHAEERPASGTTRLRLDAATWAPGLYLARLGTAEGHAATVRIVKH